MAQTCGHDHGDDGGLSGAVLADELAAAERRVDDAGERLTPPRRRVLELLLESGQAVKAYDLMALYQPGAPAKPPTVYRALEFLERQGLVHRIQSLNAYVACRRGEVHTAAFLICDCCGATTEVEPAAAKAMADQADRAGFALRAVTVEANGLCAACREDAAA
jgi:Fur family zinc uptake transcriptional regulator